MPDEEIIPLQTPAMESFNRAEIDIQIATAKKYPRPPLAQIQKRMLEFVNLKDEATGETVAESCFYVLPPRERSDGKPSEVIQGPSVRLAEVAFSCYGNMAGGAREIGNDGMKITAQGVCFDLETNTRISWEVDRQIVSRNGKVYPLHVQISVSNAAKSIAFRNAVFKAIPRALYWPVYEACLRIVAGTPDSLATRREKVFSRFEQLGVARDKLLKLVGKERIEDVDQETLTYIIGLGTAVRDGDITIAEILRESDPDKPKPERKTFKSTIEEIKAKRRKAEAEPPAPSTGGSDAA